MVVGLIKNRGKSQFFMFEMCCIPVSKAQNYFHGSYAFCDRKFCGRLAFHLRGTNVWAVHKIFAKKCISLFLYYPIYSLCDNGFHHLEKYWFETSINAHLFVSIVSKVSMTTTSHGIRDGSHLLFVLSIALDEVYQISKRCSRQFGTDVSVCLTLIV